MNITSMEPHNLNRSERGKVSMNLKKIFITIAIILACLLIWALVFNPGGIAETAWNAFAKIVNDTWKQIVGSSANDIIQPWGGGTKLDDGSGGF